VLFTTYVRTLPEVYQQVFARFAPAERDQVEFANVHRWALRYLHRHGVHLRIDPGLASRAWQTAYREVAATGSPLRKAGLTSRYLQDEVEWVVRGRALPDLDAYLALERSGRGTPLSKELRAQVWRLAERYAEELAARRIQDFSDVLQRAYEVAQRNSGTPEYDAVIVDEAQDLTEAALRLLYALVGDRSNGLLLVGDGQQSIYPGGFNLAALGVQVRGRSHVLTLNYRNTQEIYKAAQSVVADGGSDDGGGRLEPAAPAIELSRSGPPPIIASGTSEAEHDAALTAALEAAVGEGTGTGDLAILVPTNALAATYAGIVNGLGLAAQLLEDYDGTPNPLVKVGTYQRAKGLEFKRVFLPRLDADGVHEARRSGEDEQMHAERIALLRRQLFVAMSRARDGLWLGFVGAPSSLLPASLLDTSAAPFLADPATE
jgi:superfamily I DNA/RNA helicase